MNLEQLKKGQDLAYAISHLEKYDAILKDEDLTVSIDRSVHYNLDEESIELMPEEKEALKSIREAYRTVLLPANNRKLDNLRKEFEKL